MAQIIVNRGYTVTGPADALTADEMNAGFLPTVSIVPGSIDLTDVDTDISKDIATASDLKALEASSKSLGTSLYLVENTSGTGDGGGVVVLKTASQVNTILGITLSGASAELDDTVFLANDGLGAVYTAAKKVWLRYAETSIGGGAQVGLGSSATTGGAIGEGSTATTGGAAGNGSTSTTGGAIGNGATATDGFAGGNGAIAGGTGRVQLGAGTNSTDSTIQFLASGSVTATEFGRLAGLDQDLATTDSVTFAAVTSTGNASIGGTLTSTGNFTASARAILDGGVRKPATTVTSTAYTALVTDSNILVDDDTAGAQVTITLPAAATAANGFELVIMKIGGTANVVIDGSGSETINGVTTQTLTSQYESIKILTNGTAWFIIEA